MSETTPVRVVARVRAATVIIVQLRRAAYGATRIARVTA